MQNVESTIAELSDVFKQLAQLRIQIDGASFPVLAVAFCADHGVALFHVHVAPADAHCFLFTATAVLKEAKVLAELDTILERYALLAILRHPAFKVSGSKRRFAEAVNFIGRVEPVRLLFGLEPFQAVGRTGFQVTINPGGLQYIPQTGQREITRPR